MACGHTHFFLKNNTKISTFLVDSKVSGIVILNQRTILLRSEMNHTPFAFRLMEQSLPPPLTEHESSVWVWNLKPFDLAFRALWCASLRHFQYPCWGCETWIFKSRTWIISMLISMLYPCFLNFEMFSLTCWNALLRFLTSLNTCGNIPRHSRSHWGTWDVPVTPWWSILRLIQVHPGDHIAGNHDDRLTAHHDINFCHHYRYMWSLMITTR